MRGDRPFAYDLVIEYGAVSSRVALLLRSAEAKPRFFLSVPETPHLSSSIGFRRGFQCLKTSLSSRFWVFFRSRKGPCSLITFKLFRRLGPFLFANFSEIF